MAMKDFDFKSFLLNRGELLGLGLAVLLAAVFLMMGSKGFVTSGLTRAELRGLRVPPQGHGPLGRLRADGKPVRYDNLDNAPNAFGFPPKHPTMKTLLGVPIWSRGEVRGSLYVTDRDGGQPFSDEDETMLLVLARHASTIVEREWY